MFLFEFFYLFSFVFHQFLENGRTDVGKWKLFNNLGDNSLRILFLLITFILILCGDWPLKDRNGSEGISIKILADSISHQYLFLPFDLSHSDYFDNIWPLVQYRKETISTNVDVHLSIVVFCWFWASVNCQRCLSASLQQIAHSLDYTLSIKQDTLSFKIEDESIII